MTLLIWYKILFSLCFATYMPLLFAGVLGIEKYSRLLFRACVVVAVALALTFIWFGAP